MPLTCHSKQVRILTYTSRARADGGTSLIEVMLSCWEPTCGSCLLPCFIAAVIHWPSTASVVARYWLAYQQVSTSCLDFVNIIPQNCCLLRIFFWAPCNVFMFVAWKSHFGLIRWPDARLSFTCFDKWVPPFQLFSGQVFSSGCAPAIVMSYGGAIKNTTPHHTIFWNCCHSFFNRSDQLHTRQTNKTKPPVSETGVPTNQTHFYS